MCKFFLFILNREYIIMSRMREIVLLHYACK